MSPLPNLPRALLVRRMRAAAPELYTALVAAHAQMVEDWWQIDSEWGPSGERPEDNAVIARARAALALVEGPAHGS